MNIDVKKWAPWNWFNNEAEQQGKGNPSVPSLYNQNPLMELHREMDHLFDRALQRFQAPSFNPSEGFVANLMKPNVDIKEGQKSYTISVEVPGVEEDDVKLELANGVLTIRGEKKYEKEEKDENYHCVERSYGSFKRVLSLPKDSNVESIEAEFEKGILTIEVPRLELDHTDSKSKVINIKSVA